MDMAPYSTPTICLLGKFDKDALTKNSTVHKRGGFNHRERVLASVVDPGEGPGGPASPPPLIFRLN